MVSKVAFAVGLLLGVVPSGAFGQGSGDSGDSGSVAFSDPTAAIAADTGDGRTQAGQPVNLGNAAENRGVNQTSASAALRGLNQAGTAGGQAADPETRKRILKGELVPHTLMIETALKTSKDEISGIRTQLKSDVVRTSPQSLEHLKTYEKEIRSDLQTISTHETELWNSAQRYPQLVSSREYREASVALDEVRSIIQRWDQKAQSSAYWNDRRTVMSDLDLIEKRIDNAMDKTRNLNSSQLDFSPSVG